MGDDGNLGIGEIRLLFVLFCQKKTIFYSFVLSRRLHGLDNCVLNVGPFGPTQDYSHMGALYGLFCIGRAGLMGMDLHSIPYKNLTFSD